MKYILINKATKEEHICDKVTVGAFDYYIRNEEIKIGDSGWLLENGRIKSVCEFDCSKGLNGIRSTDKKIIAANDPFTEIPQIIDDVEKLAEKVYTKKNTSYKVRRSSFITGYNKSQETHPFSEEDMIAFCGYASTTGDVCRPREDSPTGSRKFQTMKEVLDTWREKQTKTIYYAHTTI